MSASEITAATLDVTTTRRTLPERSTLAMMWSHVRCTYPASSYVLTCDTWATPSQPRKTSSKQPGSSRSALCRVRRPDAYAGSAVRKPTFAVSPTSRTHARTRCPRSSRSRTTQPPMNPAAPVTATVACCGTAGIVVSSPTGRGPDPASLARLLLGDGVARLHLGGTPEVVAVVEHRVADDQPRPGEVEGCRVRVGDGGAGPPPGCPPPARASTGPSPRRGSRSSGRSPARAASGSSGRWGCSPPCWPGATCRGRTWRSPPPAAPPPGCRRAG